MGRDRIIETYVQRLLAWEAPITADTLTTLAEEVGLGPEDVATIHQTAQDHLARGRNYLDFDCLDEAIEELTQATVLEPLSLENLETLAHAYDQRYGKQKAAADKQQAIALAKRCLEINPDSEDAVILISSLDHEASGRQRILWLGVLTLVIAGAFIPVKNFITTRSEVNQLTQDIVLESPAETAEPAEPTEPAPNSTETETPGNNGIAPEVDIPIVFEHPGIALEPRLSRLNNYVDSSYYKLHGVLLNESDQELDTLRLNVEYLDKDGVAIATDSKAAIDDTSATVRPGDHHAFDLIQKINPDLASIRLSIVTLDQVPAPPSYAAATPIPYTWAFKQPPQLSFDLVARSENLNTYDIGKPSAYFDAEWAVTNTGDTALRQLKLQATYYNKPGKQILSEDILAIYGSDAPMLPGETRPVRIIQSISPDYARYEVTVLEAE